MSTKKCMDLTPEQIDWLVEHYYHPMKVEGGRDVLPVVCEQLESAGLVRVEQFPPNNLLKFPQKGTNQLRTAPSVLVISPTHQGHRLVAQIVPATILQRWGDRLSDQFLEERVIPYITLAALPELLVGDNPRWRRAAAKTAERLGRERV